MHLVAHSCLCRLNDTLFTIVTGSANKWCYLKFVLDNISYKIIVLVIYQAMHPLSPPQDQASEQQQQQQHPTPVSPPADKQQQQ